MAGKQIRYSLQLIPSIEQYVLKSLPHPQMYEAEINGQRKLLRRKVLLNGFMHKERSCTVMTCSTISFFNSRGHS